MGQSPRGTDTNHERTGIPLLNGPSEFGTRWPQPVQWTTNAPRTSQPGDTLFCVRGSTTGRMNEADQEYAIGRGLAAIRGKECSADSRYVYYALQSGLTKLLSAVTGSTFPNLSRTQISNHLVPVPDRATRWAIAEVLGALDDKIAANDRLVTTADELRGTMFASALDDGDDVPLSSLANFVNGKAFTKDASGTGRVVIRIAELNSGLGGSTVYNDIDVPDDHLARPGDLLFAWSGSLTVARWFRPEAIVNQHIFKVTPRDNRPLWLIDGALRTKLAEFQGVAADKATTMGHIQRRHLGEPVRVPSEVDVTELDEAMAGLWDRALLAEQENLRLAATRDELLPLLMSGKIRVRDEEQAVEGVT